MPPTASCATSLASTWFCSARAASPICSRTWPRSCARRCQTPTGRAWQTSSVTSSASDWTCRTTSRRAGEARSIRFVQLPREPGEANQHPELARWSADARDEPRLVLRRCRCRPTCSQNFLRTDAKLQIGSRWHPFGPAVSVAGSASRVSAATSIDRLWRACNAPLNWQGSLPNARCCVCQGLVAVRRWRQPGLDRPKCLPAVKFHP